MITAHQRAQTSIVNKRRIEAELESKRQREESERLAAAEPVVERLVKSFETVAECAVKMGRRQCELLIPSYLIERKGYHTAAGRRALDKSSMSLEVNLFIGKLEQAGYRIYAFSECESRKDPDTREYELSEPLFGIEVSW